MLSPLFAHIRKFTPLAAKDEEILASLVVQRKVKKKEFLYVAGDIFTANHFVQKGCFRMYVNTDQGTEQIIQFAIDNWWITDYMSLDHQRPSVFSLQAVEDSDIAIIHRSVQDELFKRVPQLEHYFRVILQRALAAQVMRIHYIFNESGEERYRHFNASFPDFVQRVPQYMLASYLGFTPEFLSKIRGKRAKPDRS
jgi:CRP-like cAMP-binding protein